MHSSSATTKPIRASAHASDAHLPWHAAVASGRVAESELWRGRFLVQSLLDEADGWGLPEFGPWFEQHPHVVGELREVGVDGGRRRLPSGDAVLMGLYAVNRLTDLLIGPHQPDSASGVSMSAWADFMGLVGATVIAEERFHPFFHEIVAVEPADDPAEPATVVRQHWPGAMVAGMVLVRGGVTVRAGSAVMDPVAAARSCMYWTWMRHYRPVRDLSHGWGHNSQWRTDFRRDYLVGDELRYNVDHIGARPVLVGTEDDLSEVERRDLVRFRHGVRRDLGEDLFPFDDVVVERRLS